jgi:gas vesicle protein
MSYAGPTRTRGTARSASAPPVSRSTATRQSARPADRVSPGDTDWQQVAIFGAGVALGIAVGAGAALLAAPYSGRETRAVLVAKAGRLGRSTSRRSRDVWDDLRDEIRGAQRALRRRRLRRAAEQDLRREMALEGVAD